MTHTVSFETTALRRPRKIDPRRRKRILQVVREPAADPRPPGAKALQGRSGYRMRVCDHRVLCTVHDGKAEVRVLRTGHR